jgi:hypothetical protein
LVLPTAFGETQKNSLNRQHMVEFCPHDALAHAILKERKEKRNKGENGTQGQGKKGREKSDE